MWYSTLSFMLLVASVSCLSWEPRDVPAEIRQQQIKLGTQYCQTFPAELAPMPDKYAPLMDLIDEFATNISALVAIEGTPSLTVNLIYDQDILWTQGYGLKNLSDPSAGPPDGDSIYRIGSNTKLFTTLLALIAQDKGLLDFTDQVQQHIPAFQPTNPFPSRRQLNFAQLASHMAGLPRESPCLAFMNKCNEDNAEMWQRFQNVTLVNPPSFIPQYSNAGFAVLGHIVEEIMESQWADLVLEEILSPLDMNNTGTNITDQNFLVNRAIGYTVNDAEAPVQDIGWESPAGSMYSSTNDMAKFVSLFFRDSVPYMAQQNQILDSLSLREWRQPRYINIDSTGYGLPWEIIQSPIIYTKGGAIGGYLSLTVTVPQLKLGMIILQSSDAVSTYAQVFQMWAAYFITPFAQILQNISPAPYIPPGFANYTGTYIINNLTAQIQIVETKYYPVPIISVIGASLPLQYFDDNVFRMTIEGVFMTCGLQQTGMEQYIYFVPSSPPTFSVPGLFPGVYASKIE